MKLLTLILILFPLLAWSQSQKSSSNAKLMDMEVDDYLSTAHARQVEQQLTESDLFKQCKENPENKTIANVEECVRTQFDSPDFDVKSFADKTNLKSFDVKASKDAGSIRQYLSQRLTNALYGPDNKKKKLKKLVDHGVFSALYRSQIGKNILLEVSNYCLVNLGIEDKPYQLVNYCIKTNDGKYPFKSCDGISKQITSTTNPPAVFGGGPIGGTTIIFEEAKGGYKKEDQKDAAGNIIGKKLTFDPTNFSTTAFSYMDKTFWKNAYEYELNESCQNSHTNNVCYTKYKKDDGSDGEQLVRNNSFLSAAKEVEFQLGADYMRDKYKFCAFSAIQNMCEVYRCNNTYDFTKIEQEKVDNCKRLGITANDPTKPQTGTKACALLARLKEYRRSISALDTIDDYNKKLIKNKGYKASMYQGGYYNSGNGPNEKSVEELTTISSTELGSKTKLGLSKDELDKLRDECINTDGSLAEDKKCQRLVNDLKEEDAKNISAEMEAQTQLYLKRIDALEDSESIKEYLVKHGLSKYVSKVDEDPDLLKRLIRDQYQSERDALKQTMMEKFHRLTNKPPADNTNDPTAAAQDLAKEAGKLATESMDNLEKQKEAIQTLFQYNNVISSYMSAKIGEGDDAKSTELAYQRDIELQGMNEFGKDKDEYTKYESMLKDDKSGSSSGNEQMQVDLKFIDSLLGNTKPDDNQ